MKMRYFIYFIFAVFFFFTIEEKTAFPADSLRGVGKHAPDFELKDISGKRVALSGYKGKVVLINFWATWCGPCKAEMPSLNNLYKTYKDKGVVVLAISVDSSEKPVRSFVSERGLTFPVLMDSDKEVSFDLFGVVGLPTSFLIDKNGVVVEKFMGEREWDSPDMKNKILRLLSGR